VTPTYWRVSRGCPPCGKDLNDLKDVKDTGNWEAGGNEGARLRGTAPTSAILWLPQRHPLATRYWCVTLQ